MTQCTTVAQSITVKEAAKDWQLGRHAHRRTRRFTNLPVEMTAQLSQKLLKPTVAALNGSFHCVTLKKTQPAILHNNQGKAEQESQSFSSQSI